MDVVVPPYVHCLDEAYIAALASATDDTEFRQILTAKAIDETKCVVVPPTIGMRVTDIREKLTPNGGRYYCYRQYDAPGSADNDCTLAPSLMALAAYLKQQPRTYTMVFNDEARAATRCFDGSTVLLEKLPGDRLKRTVLLKFGHMGAFESVLTGVPLGLSIENGCTGDGPEFPGRTLP